MVKERVDIHQDLVNRCRSNDRQAQQEIYYLYAKPMFNVSYRILNQQEEAEDVLQEAFVKMFHQIGSYRAEASFGAWFKRIVINQSLNRLKQRNRERVQIENLTKEKYDQGEENDEISVPKATIAEIQNAMELLPEGYRLVFVLYLFEEYSHQEIAEELGISVSTSKSQLNRAKKKLKELLKEEAHEKN